MISLQKIITKLISTHTPLAGRDSSDIQQIVDLAISTHTPLAGRDNLPRPPQSYVIPFLLTRPSRGVTWR